MSVRVNFVEEHLSVGIQELAMTSWQIRLLWREILFAVAPGPGAVACSSGRDAQLGQQPLREQQPSHDEGDHPDPVRHVVYGRIVAAQSNSV